MEEESIKIGEKLAPFNPTSDIAITNALEFFCLTEEDVLYDLGCGDGRFLLRACEEVCVLYLLYLDTLWGGGFICLMSSLICMYNCLLPRVGVMALVLNMIPSFIQEL